MRRFLFTTIVLSLFLPKTALALDWEVERNFRYFLHPSDLAIQLARLMQRFDEFAHGWVGFG